MKSWASSLGAASTRAKRKKAWSSTCPPSISSRSTAPRSSPTRASSSSQIAELLNASFLNGRRIIVEGHADGIGAEAYNKTLSDKRAEAVVSELVAAGVERGRLTKRAFGKERPLEPNKRPDGSDNPEGRARNRRVALIVENPKS